MSEPWWPPADGVLGDLLTAGMRAATHAVRGDQTHGYGTLLQRIAFTVLEGYGARIVTRELCATAALVLCSRQQGVRIGELVCSKQDDVWTFVVDEQAHAEEELRTAAQLVCVFANVQEQYDDDWESAGNPFWQPPAGASSDVAAWNQIVDTIPSTSFLATTKALFVIAGVLATWAGDSTSKPSPEVDVE